MSEKNPVAEYIETATAAVTGMESGTAERITGTIFKALHNRGKILVCGNGGCAADGSHFAGELVGRFRRERRGMAAIALSSDTSVVTALGNDYGFDGIFERQVEALGMPGDILVALSTSGTSRNILRAARRASEMDIKVIAFTSASCSTADWADIHWRAPSAETSHAQEQMIIVLHGICYGLEVLLEEKS